MLTPSKFKLNLLLEVIVDTNSDAAKIAIDGVVLQVAVQTKGMSGGNILNIRSSSSTCTSSLVVGLLINRISQANEVKIEVNRKIVVDSIVQTRNDCCAHREKADISIGGLSDLCSNRIFNSGNSATTAKTKSKLEFAKHCKLTKLNKVVTTKQTDHEHVVSVITGSSQFVVIRGGQSSRCSRMDVSLASKYFVAAVIIAKTSTNKEVLVNLIAKLRHNGQVKTGGCTIIVNPVSTIILIGIASVVDTKSSADDEFLATVFLCADCESEHCASNC